MPEPAPSESMTLKEFSATKRLLLCLAHPDDESFGAPPVGTILRYAQAGEPPPATPVKLKG